MILETVLIWTAAVILAVVFSPLIFLMSIVLISLALFLFFVAIISSFVVLGLIVQIIAWPFRKLAKLFTKKKL